ncbi:MAG: P-loop NTPase fold protein, partial [Pseudomonadota bacterium]
MTVNVLYFAAIFVPSKTRQKQMWSDNETEDDFLNFEDTVESVLDILLRQDLHPLSLGLFGGWGSGKSSLLQMVMGELRKV